MPRWQDRPVHLHAPDRNAFTGDLRPVSHVAEIATMAWLDQQLAPA